MKISCLIPVYNEAHRVGRVLNAVEKIDKRYLHEIIVIDDGSSDGTAEEISKWTGITLITLKKNSGKSAAIYEGLKRMTGDTVFLLDADLLGITEKNIMDLLLPVYNGTAQASLSLRINTAPGWHIIGLDYVSGERIFPKYILEGHLEKLPTLRRFGLEVFINNLWVVNHIRFKVVRWNNVKSTSKYKKFGFWHGLKGDIKMRSDIFHTVTPLNAARQIIDLLRLRTS